MNTDELNATKYFSTYNFNIAQCRIDIWNDLKMKAGELSKKFSNDEDYLEIRDDINSLLSFLNIIEPYWAFPGMANLENLKTLFNNKSFFAFYNQVIDMVWELVSESYRRKALDHMSKKGT